MNPWTALSGALQQLPRSVRRALYSLVTAAGAVLAVAQIAGWKSIGPIDVDSAMRTYALIASPTGVLALANTGPREGRDEPRGRYADEADDDVRYDDTYDDTRYAEDGDASDALVPAPSDEASFS